jgi:hypothetical protein
MKNLFRTLSFVLLSVYALSQNSIQSAKSTNTATVVVAAGGKAYIVTETSSGISTKQIKTSRPVLSAFGFGPDGVTLVYTALDKTGTPIPGLYTENVGTGYSRKVSEKIVFKARWSPRGDYTIAYTFADEYGTGVATVNAASGAEIVLTHEGVLSDSLEWDNSGHRLYFTRADEESQLVYREGIKRPIEERPYTILRQRAIQFDPLGQPDAGGPMDVESNALSTKLPSVKRQLRAGELSQSVYDDDSPLPDNLYSFSMKSAGGAEIVGDNLLGDGTIYVRAGPAAEKREIARGQLVTAMGHGAIVREFNQGETVTKYASFDGKSIAIAATAVTYGLPLASAVVTQGGASYSSPGNCKIFDHTASSSMAYAYDFQNSTSGAHVMAAAQGVVVYVKKDVTCNSCDKEGCSAYPSGGCTNSNSGWGNVVIIQHADGTYTKYTHLQVNSVQVAVGNTVCPGRYIGRQGFTGCTIGSMEGCGSHLHFQRQSSSALSGTSQAITFAESPSSALSCGTYRSSLTEKTSCSSTGQARPVISSSLRLSGGPYCVGQTINSYFTITNRGTQSITFNRLLTGGRLNGDQTCSGGCPDFSSISNVTLSPGQSYAYSGSRFLDRSGTYSFFVAYQKTDGTWVTSIETENGTINSLSIAVQNAPPKLTSRSPSTIYASAYDQTVYLYGTGLTNTSYVYVQFPGGGAGYIYPPAQIFSRSYSTLGCKIKFGTRGQYYLWAYTPEGGWSNSIGIYVY